MINGVVTTRRNIGADKDDGDLLGVETLGFEPEREIRQMHAERNEKRREDQRYAQLEMTRLDELFRRKGRQMT